MTEHPRESGENRKIRSYLLGIGLDESEGEFRVTRSEDYQILGGSEKTHRKMHEKILRLEEHLAADGRKIRSLRPDEYEEVSRFLKDK